MAKNLSDYVEAVAAKTLSAVEANKNTSNQHEFNGVTSLKAMLGEERQNLNAKFMYISDNQEEPLSSDGFVTWYDARDNNPDRSEFRLYFPSNIVTESLNEGDLLVVLQLIDGRLLLVAADSASNSENQLRWLFGLSGSLSNFSLVNLDRNDRTLGFGARLVLDEIGLLTHQTDESYLAEMIDSFGDAFPTTRKFSSFARSTLSDVDPVDQPDEALVSWFAREESLFRTFEKHLVAERLKAGFEDDIDGFISFSLSVHNRRKSRAGHALENHMEQILLDHNIQYSRGARTEGKAKPDFLFPGIDNYRDPEYPAEKLTMLGSKTSAKDRWRQILTEAERIPAKHLLTLEPGISPNQTDEMKEHNVSLVLPEELHESYLNSQRPDLINIEEFLSIIKCRQQ